MSSRSVVNLTQFLVDPQYKSNPRELTHLSESAKVKTETFFHSKEDLRVYDYCRL